MSTIQDDRIHLGARRPCESGHGGAIVHNEPEMPLVVCWLRASFHERDELVAHVDEGDAFPSPAQLEFEDPPVEGERLVDVSDLERYVVDAYELWLLSLGHWDTSCQKRSMRFRSSGNLHMDRLRTRPRAAFKDGASRRGDGRECHCARCFRDGDPPRRLQPRPAGATSRRKPTFARQTAPAPYSPAVRRSATATASVIARQKVAASERNEPKSLSTISNRTSARPASGDSALSVTTTVGVFARRARLARSMVKGE